MGGVRIENKSISPYVVKVRYYDSGKVLLNQNATLLKAMRSFAHLQKITYEQMQAITYAEIYERNETTGEESLLSSTKNETKQYRLENGLDNVEIEYKPE